MTMVELERNCTSSNCNYFRNLKDTLARKWSISTAEVTISKVNGILDTHFNARPSSQIGESYNL